MMPRMSPEDEEFARACAGDGAVDQYLRAAADYAMPVFVPMRGPTPWATVVSVSAAIVVGFALALR